MSTNQRWQDELDIVKDRLSKYYAAETAILSGAQEYRIGGRSLRRGDLKYIQDEIERLRNRREELERVLETMSSPTQRKSYRVIFRDL